MSQQEGKARGAPRILNTIQVNSTVPYELAMVLLGLPSGRRSEITSLALLAVPEIAEALGEDNVLRIRLAYADRNNRLEASRRKRADKSQRKQEHRDQNAS